jgi:hypothetical protein
MIMFNRNKKIKYKLFLIVCGMESMSTQFKDRSERADDSNEKSALQRMGKLLDYWIDEIKNDVLSEREANNS